jgi:hypothetical protein
VRDIYVYVAGPYTKPDPCINTHEFIKLCDQLTGLGYVPFCPHLSHFWHTMIPHDYRFWLDYDKKWLARCDVMLRVAGFSVGADEEEEFANAQGIPVVRGLSELHQWRKDHAQ